MTAQLSDMAAPLNTVEWGLPIAPGETIQVPFGLPEDVPITDETRVTVTARTLGPPAHTWPFADQPIRPATPAPGLSELSLPRYRSPAARFENP